MLKHPEQDKNLRNISSLIARCALVESKYTNCA